MYYGDMEHELSEAVRSPCLRRDAEHNRTLVVRAARELFGARGIHVPLEEIARQAGVGIATLYRRFPTRQSLIDEIFGERLQAALQAAEEALRAPSGWDGFYGYVFRLCAMQAQDCGSRDVLMTTFPASCRLQAIRLQGHVLAKQIIARAQEEGTLRTDFTAEDLVFILLANGAFVAASRPINPDAWRRYVALLLDGCRAEYAGPLPVPALSEADMFRAMRQIVPPGPAQEE